VTPSPTLTAIVPATDRPGTLARCVESIQTAIDPPLELMVIERCEQRGPAAARNAGARRAKGDVIVFVDSDVAVHRDAFLRIRSTFAADPSLTALFGSYDDTPGGEGVVSAFRDLLHHHVHQQADRYQGTFWAGLGAIRRDAFLAAGGFDAARYPAPSIEDIELGMRLHQSGARIELHPGLLGNHLKQWTLPRMVRTDLFHRGVPWVALLLRERTHSTALNLSWRNRLSAAAAVWVAALVALRRRVGSALALGAFMLINRPFHALLWRRLGPAGAAAGVLLHLVHHLAGAAALPLGAAAYLRDRAGTRISRLAARPTRMQSAVR
jgi:GT2 family glycosyltransferase